MAMVSICYIILATGLRYCLVGTVFFTWISHIIGNLPVNRNQGISLWVITGSQYLYTSSVISVYFCGNGNFCTFMDSHNNPLQYVIVDIHIMHNIEKWFVVFTQM